MVKVMCQTPEVIRLGELTPFQGDLKRRTEKDVTALADSIREEGLLMPFAVWKHKGVNSLLDGHGRLSALTEIALQDNSVATQEFPVLFIEADTEEQARKSLLQITSSYGKITRDGVMKFCATIPEYHAPSINKFVHKKTVNRKLPAQNNTHILKIAVNNDKLDAVLDLFKKCEYIRVL